MLKKLLIAASLTVSFSALAQTPSQTAIWQEYKSNGAYDWVASRQNQDKRITTLQDKRDNYDIPDIFNPPAEYVAIDTIVQLALMQCAGDDIDLENLDDYVD